MSIQNINLLVKNKICPVLFLGAGASVESGSVVAKTITFDILRKYYAIEGEDILSERFHRETNLAVEFESVVTWIAQNAGARITVLNEYFREMKPSIGYQYLAMMLKAGYFFPVVFTTNWEDMILRALEAESLVSKKYKITCILQEDLTDSTKINNNEILIVYLHGSLSRPESIKVATSEMINLTTPCSNFMKRMIIENGMFFIGVSGRDIDIRNTLQSAPTTKKQIFWTSLHEPQDTGAREIYASLNHHKSERNYVWGLSFDQVFVELGKPLETAIKRKKIQGPLDSAWRRLDHVRSFKSKRTILLKGIIEFCETSLNSLQLLELEALYDLTKYELNKSGELYRLQHGVALLRQVVSEYESFLDVSTLNRLRVVMLRELLNMFLNGDEVSEGRFSSLDYLINSGSAFEKTIPNTDVVIKAECLLILAEAYKEKAMVTNVIVDQTLYTTKARDLCIESRKIVANHKDAVEKEYFNACSMRHEAVTYELQGDLEKDAVKREGLYQKWKNLSSEAVESLKKIGEDCIRAYATINLCSAELRLLDHGTHSTYHKKKKLTQIEEVLNSVLPIYDSFSDWRGKGWTLIHLCEVGRSICALQTDPHLWLKEALKIESNATSAISELRKTEDQLAMGLAYKQLGTVLEQKARNIKTDDASSLKRAQLALKKGIVLLEKVGYHRGLGETYNTLAMAQNLLWRISNNKNELVESVRSTLSGLNAVAAAIDSTDSLEDVYSKLSKELNSLL